jgi:hypothetical protein
MVVAGPSRTQAARAPADYGHGLASGGIRRRSAETTMGLVWLLSHF